MQTGSLSSSMRNILLITVTMLLVLAGCAPKKAPFNLATSLQDAESDMQHEDFAAARKEYERIQEKSPEKAYDAAIMLRIADTYFGEEKYAEALVEYRNFLNYHPANKDAPYAQFQIGLCSFKQLTTIDRDPTPASTTITEMQKLLDTYPNSGYEDEAKRYIAICRNWLADYELYVARFYFKKDSYRAAAGRCDTLLTDYPGSRAEKNALYLCGEAYRDYGEIARARDAFDTLAHKYPAMQKKAQAGLATLPAP